MSENKTLDYRDITINKWQKWHDENYMEIGVNRKTMLYNIIDDCCNEANARIQSLQKQLSDLQQRNGWISVDERLPEQEQGFYMCLGFTSSGHETIKLAFNCLTKKFQTLNFDVTHDLITHWMPYLTTLDEDNNKFHLSISYTTYIALV